MKLLLQVLAAVALAHAEVRAEEPGPAVFTKEEALKKCRTMDGRDTGKKWFEQGDETGPYVHAGRFYLLPGTKAGYAVAGKNGELSEVGIDVPDDAAVLHMDFFTSKSGQGWVTTHYFEPEVRSEPEAGKDKLSPQQKALGPAAEFAIEKGNLSLLEILLANGVEIDGALDSKSGDTLLHTAVMAGQLKIAKVLLDRGASREIRDGSGKRPIDLALDYDRPDFKKLLAKADTEDSMIDGVPAGVLEEIFVRHHDHGLHFVRWNGKDPSEELLEHLRKAMPGARPASRMKTLERRPLGARTWYQEKDTGEFGNLLEATAEREGDTWKVRLRTTVGPSLAGGGWEAKVEKVSGYWHRHDGSVWAE
jgi:hypothetical protein